MKSKFALTLIIIIIVISGISTCYANDYATNLETFSQERYKVISKISTSLGLKSKQARISLFIKASKKVNSLYAVIYLQKYNRVKWNTIYTFQTSSKSSSLNYYKKIKVSTGKYRLKVDWKATYGKNLEKGVIYSKEKTN